MPASLIAAIPALPALLLGFWLMQTGNTFQGTILSIRSEIEGFALAQIGAVGAAFWAGVIIGSLYAARVIRRVGHIRTFAAFGAIAATAPLVHLLVIDPFAWMAARAVTGFCFAGMFVVVESWLNAGASSENRGQVLSIYGMTGLLAGVCGQLLLPATDPAGFRAFCIITCIISLALVPIALTQGAAPAPPGEGNHVGLGRLYRDSPLGVVAGFLSGVTTGAFFTLGPIFAEGRGLTIGQIAIFMACGTVGGFVAAWPLGLLSDRYDRRLVITGAAAAAAASLIAMIALVPGDAYPWLLYLCVALFGGMIIPTYSLALAHLSDAVEQEEMVAASSGLLLAHGAGAAAGPLIAGFAMSATPRGLSYTLVVAQGLIVVFGVWRLIVGAKVPSTHKSAFMVEPPVPVGTEFAAAHSTHA
jgi:MFS family permease